MRFFSSFVWGGCPKIVEDIRGSLCPTLSAFKTRVWVDPTIVSFSACCLRGGREGKPEKRAVAPAVPPAPVSLHSQVAFKLMKAFSSTAAAQLSRAHLTTFSSIPGPLAADPTRSPVGLYGTRSVQRRHGWVWGAELEFGALGAPFAQCGHGGSCGGM